MKTNRTIRSKRYRVAKRLHVEFCFGPDGFGAEWDPKPPYLKGVLLRRYRMARADFMEMLSRETGGGAMIIEAASDEPLATYSSDGTRRVTTRWELVGGKP